MSGTREGRRVRRSETDESRSLLRKRDTSRLLIKQAY